MFVLILLSLVASIFAQVNPQAPTCQQLANQTTFETCAAALLKVKGTMGAQRASDQVGACYVVQQGGNSTAYGQCLCAKTSAILKW
jgi:hypothetical protein